MDLTELMERLNSELEDLQRIRDELAADHTKATNPYWSDALGSVGYRLNDIAMELDEA